MVCTRCVTAGRAARDDGIVHLRVEMSHRCVCVFAACTRGTHDMGRRPGELRGDDEGLWSHGGMDACAMDMSTKTRERGRERQWRDRTRGDWQLCDERGCEGQWRDPQGGMAADAMGMGAMTRGRGREGQWRDRTRVRGTIVRWDAWATTAPLSPSLPPSLIPSERGID